MIRAGAGSDRRFRELLPQTGSDDGERRDCFFQRIEPGPTTRVGQSRQSVAPPQVLPPDIAAG